jgi:hypothetical protein
MSDKEFVDGLLVKAPHEKAPDFVKCSISIKRKDLGNWLRQKDDEWINIDVKVAKSGKWYAEVSHWKPKPKQDADITKPDIDPNFDQDIPF